MRGEYDLQGEQVRAGADQYIALLDSQVKAGEMSQEQAQQDLENRRELVDRLAQRTYTDDNGKRYTEMDAGIRNSTD